MVRIILTQCRCPVCGTVVQVTAPVRVTRHAVLAPARCPECGLQAEVHWRSNLWNRLYESGGRRCDRVMF